MNGHLSVSTVILTEEGPRTSRHLRHRAAVVAASSQASTGTEHGGARNDGHAPPTPMHSGRGPSLRPRDHCAAIQHHHRPLVRMTAVEWPRLNFNRHPDGVPWNRRPQLREQLPSNPQGCPTRRVARPGGRTSDEWAHETSHRRRCDLATATHRYCERSSQRRSCAAHTDAPWTRSFPPAARPLRCDPTSRPASGQDDSGFRSRRSAKLSGSQRAARGRIVPSPA